MRKDALTLRIVAAEQVVEQQLGRTVALHMCVLVDQEVDHAAADVLDICWDKVVADEADAACRSHFSQRLARADLAVYRDVHTAEVGMLAQRTAHDVVGELLIVAAVLGREQLESCLLYTSDAADDA